MKIGILGDTHDNLPMIERAVTYLNNKKVELVLHTGDYVAPFSVKILNKLICNWYGVFGNNDGERDGLLKTSEGKIASPPLLITLDSKNFILIHDIGELNVNSGKSDYIVFGHSHKNEYFQKGDCIYINPGECCGWISGKPTFCILETKDKKVNFFNITKI